MSYAFEFLCICAFALVLPLGCSEATGAAGTGGLGGSGGTGIEIECEPNSDRCVDGKIGPIVACCDLEAPPEQANACSGMESIVNPASCTETGDTVTYKVTVLKVADSCNSGYDLDMYDGWCCFPGPLAPSEGLHGVDNAMSGLALELESIGSNLSVVNQTFSDGLCGLTDACSQVIPSIDVRFEVDLNIDEKCASVEVVSVEDSSNVMLNLSDRVTGSGTCTDGAGGNGGTDGGEGCTSDADCARSLRCEGGVVCASGVIGTIPLAITGEVRSVGSGFVRMTVSRDGFSDGLLGATFDEETAVALAEANGGDPDVGAVVRQALDHSEEFVGTSVACSALSATLEIGGVAVQTD